MMATQAAVLKDHTLVPESSWPVSAALVVLSALFTALCAQISVRLPFTPVPITGSTLGVLYAGALLGPRRGAASAALYLAMGTAGLPVFAGASGGWPYLFGATGGYLVGFVPAAWLAGTLARRGWDRSPITCAGLMLASSAVVFAFGVAVLSFFVPRGRALELGFYPFVIGDLAKSCLSAALIPTGWRLLGRS